MERPEIVELFYSALVDPNDVEQLSQFLSPRVQWILSAADPQTSGEASPSNAIKIFGQGRLSRISVLFAGQLTRDFWKPHRLYYASPTRFRFRKGAIAKPWNCQLVEQISLPNSRFRDLKSSRGKYGFRGRWCLIVKRFRPTSYLPVETLYFSLLNDVRL